MKRLPHFTIILLLTPVICLAQNFDKIDSLALNLIEKYHLPGIGVVGVKNNSIVYKNTFGKANETSDFTDATQIYIASNTKAFVGLAMSKLASENKISYEDPIANYIDASHFPENIEVSKITVKNLLEHTHGLSNDPLIFRTAYSGEYPSNLKELLKFTVYRNDTLSYDFKYSNLGYLLAGIIIETVTGQNWKDYVMLEILNPIGLQHTSANMDFDKSLEVLPYEFYSKAPISSKKTENVLHSAGGFYSTLEDMGKWLTVFTDKDQKRINQALLQKYLNVKTHVGQRMGPFSMDEYGNGWIHGNIMGEKLLFHFGSFSGYESMMSFKSENNCGVFVFVNERVGGQRIAAMLSAYYYLVESNDTNPDEKIKMFTKFIAPLYSEGKNERSIYKFKNLPLLTGTYYNEKYGNLIVDKDANGYSFSIGRLKSYAYSNNENKEDIIIEWTPGIKEHFIFEQNKNNIKLIYGDFGEFIKQ